MPIIMKRIGIVFCIVFAVTVLISFFLYFYDTGFLNESFKEGSYVSESADEKIIEEMMGHEYIEFVNRELNPKKIYPKEIIDINPNKGEILNYNSFLKGESNLIVKTNDSIPTITLDFGQLIVGYFKIEAESLSVGDIKVELKQTLNDDEWKIPPQERQESRYSLKKGLNVLHEPTIRRVFRYMKLSVIGVPEPDLTILRSVYVEPIGHPVYNRGYFLSSDSLLNKIWIMGVYTVRLCMQNYYEDGVARDRALWIGDFREEALTNYYTFGDAELAKRSLILLSLNKNKKNAIISVTGLTTEDWIFPDYVSRWITALYEYYLFTGDINFIRSQYPLVREQIEYLTSKLNSNGLIEVRDDGITPAFDWASSRRQGEVSYHQIVFYKALLDAAELADAIGFEDDSRNYRELALRIKENTNRYLWSPERGAYIDYINGSIVSSRVPQDANVLAINYGVADRERSRSILLHLQKHWSLYGSFTLDKPYSKDEQDYVEMRYAISPYMNSEEADAYFKMGESSMALELIKLTWGNMINKNSTTTWEFVGEDGQPETPSTSLAHGWSGKVSYVLQSNVLGIKPLASGFSKIIITPHLENLSWTKGVVPTPKGLIGVSYHEIEDGIPKKLEIFIPNDSLVHVGIPSFNKSLSVYLNDNLIWQDDKLKKSSGLLIDSYEKDGYVYFVISNGGLYRFYVKTER